MMREVAVLFTQNDCGRLTTSIWRHLIIRVQCCAIVILINYRLNLSVLGVHWLLLLNSSCMMIIAKYPLSVLLHNDLLMLYILWHLVAAATVHYEGERLLHGCCRLWGLRIVRLVDSTCLQLPIYNSCWLFLQREPDRCLHRVY